MAIDPNIALGYKPIQLEQRNPLAEYAQIQNIQTGQLQNQLARQQMEQEQGVINYLGSANLSTPEGISGLNKFGKTGLGYAKLIAEQEANALKSKEMQGKLREQQMSALGTGLTSVMNDPTDEKLGQAFDRLDATGVDTKKLRDQFGKLTDLESRKAGIQSYVMSHPEGRAALAFVQPKPMQVKRADGSVIFLDENPNSPTFKREVLPAQAAGMTPHERASLGIQAGNLAVNQSQLALAQANATKPVFNPATGGFITPPTQENPQGTFTPVAGIQETKDQQAAVKALKSAGYDPATGEDNISKLIAKSTSGGLQAGTAATLAFFGKTTEGRKAIAALEGTANQIATDLAGGKLGAGISNTDRDFIVGALGDVSNPMKTSAERLAGWAAAKNRMVNTGVIPAPAGAPAPAATQGTGGFKYLGKESK